jgi:carboxypeptidase PM20D1
LILTIAVIAILALLVLLIVLLINAVRLKPAPVHNPLPDVSEQLADEKCVDRFREILKIRTVWNENDSGSDNKAFDDFLPKLRSLYPDVFNTLELKLINTYGIMLVWRGANNNGPNNSSVNNSAITTNAANNNSANSGAVSNTNVSNAANNTNKSLAPVVLMAHHDVVDADPASWEHDPFAATVVDGRIYARGAVDTKCILAAQLEAVSILLKEGFVPPRDIYICSSNCEEVLGDTAEQMVDYFRQQGITPALALDEGGAVIDDAPLGVKSLFAAIGVCEKGLIRASVTVKGMGGHAANPSLSDSTSMLVMGLNKLLKHPAASKLSAPVEAMLVELAAHGSFGLRLIFGNLWLFRPLVLYIMRKNPETAAMVRSTYALTQLQGSTAANVIPRRASASVNIRVDPNENVNVALNRLKWCFGDSSSKNANSEASGGSAKNGNDFGNDSNSTCDENDRGENDNSNTNSDNNHFYVEKNSASFSQSNFKGVSYELDEAIDPSPISRYDDETFGYLRKVIHSVYPTAGIAPYVQSSASDARFFARICPHTYRFAGFLFHGDQRSSIHAPNENLDVQSYLRGVVFYTEFIRNLGLLK